MGRKPLILFTPNEPDALWRKAIEAGLMFDTLGDPPDTLIVSANAGQVAQAFKVLDLLYASDERRTIGFIAPAEIYRAGVAVEYNKAAHAQWAGHGTMKVVEPEKPAPIPTLWGDPIIMSELESQILKADPVDGTPDGPRPTDIGKATFIDLSALDASEVDPDVDR